MRGITKRFPGVLANDAVDFEAAAGEVHALLGENGAGKSTLSNILTGLYRPDEGEILIRGEPVRFDSPSDAIDAGIGMVHQHFRLVPPFTVAENIVLGEHREEARRFVLHPRRIEQQVAGLGERYGIAVEPHARIWQLSVGEQQRVEILKALYREAKILILDEPTAVLTPQESEALFGTLRTMAAEGRTVIFISHKLHEVKAVADRVTVLRGGRAVATLNTADATSRELAALMVGREVDLARRIDRDAPHGEDAALEVEESERARRSRRAGAEGRVADGQERRDPRRRGRRRERPARARRGDHRHPPGLMGRFASRGVRCGWATRARRSQRAWRTSRRTGWEPASRQA